MEDINRQTGLVEAQDVAAKPQKPRKVRGWMTLHSDDSLEFRPSAEGTAAKVCEKKRGNSSFYRTNSHAGTVPVCILGLCFEFLY